MDPQIAWEIVCVALFLAMSAFYSATETAFGCLHKFRFKVEADEGSKTAKLIVFLYEHYDTTLVSVLIGNDLFQVGLSSISTLLFLNIFQSVIDDSLVSLIASIVMAVLVFLFGDTIPKVIAKRIPDQTARFAAWPMAFFVILFYPVSLFFRFFMWLFKKIFKTKAPPELSEEDFNNVVEKIAKEGALEKNESGIIQASFDFADTSVKDVLTPAKSMAMIDLKGLKQDDLLDYLAATKYSRLPVYYGSRDKVVGVLVVKNYLNAYFKDPKVQLLPLISKPFIVSPKVMIDDLIEGFRDHKSQIAIVMADGHLVGMVTTEDVLEELVGSIDENSQPVTTNSEAKN